MKNKIVIIIMVIMTMTFTVTLSNAAENYIDEQWYDNIEIEKIPLTILSNEALDGYDKCIIVEDKAGIFTYDYAAIFYNGNMYKLYNKTKDRYVLAVDSATSPKKVEYDDGEWKTSIGVCQKTDIISLGANEIKASTHDVYNSVDIIDVFFSATRIIPTPTPRILLQPQQLTQVNHQIAGLIPYLIGLIIVSVGLWKALQFLFKILHKA